MESKCDQTEFDVKKGQIKELESLVDTGYLDLFYYDESLFNLTPNIPYAWQKKGQTIKLPCAKSKSINVAGFYSKDNQFFDYQFTETINSDKAIEVSVKLPSKNLTLIRIIDSLGKKQFKDNFKEAISIPVDTYVSGTYFIVLENEKGTAPIVLKFIIQR